MLVLEFGLVVPGHEIIDPALHVFDGDAQQYVAPLRIDIHPRVPRIPTQRNILDINFGLGAILSQPLGKDDAQHWDHSGSVPLGYRPPSRP